ncbi:V-type ATPase 116kDa subunit family protein [Legionella sp. km772]|uniref:V-type ATPase 116kDa subunit family protein n=1 Tax=Legionella sp. km772 TaxID=2498111 RepID=UPI000F8EF108|nr:V-type ATPase 116kDa subunit family protein [Legionella sp. km772]RUR05896.1 V-type ATP synthase subunit I [Legionella sp. km772]
MSIAAFKKVTLAGLSRCKDELLLAVQELGCLHLIALNPKTKSTLTTTSTTVLDEIKASLRYLKASPDQGSPRLFWKGATPNQVVQQILSNQRAFRECTDRRDFLTMRIRALKEWGNFVLPAQAALNGIKLWFYKLPLKKLALLNKELPLQEVYRNQSYIFIVLCAEEEPHDDALSVYRVHTGSCALNELLQELDELNEQIEDLIDERRSLTRFRYLLSKEVAQFADRSELKKAKEKIQNHEVFFLVQGWIPEQGLENLEAFCVQQHIGLTIEMPLDEELPPTLLESSTWLKGGKELVNFYQTPGYHSLDPSIMVFFSFALFFAMILADAGYGLILALFTLFTWKRLNKYAFSSWFKPLLAVISLFSIIYGVLLGSYWGVEPKEGSFLAHLHIINIHNFKAMMYLVIVIGCVHICIGCGMRAWFARERNSKIQAIGFIILITSVLMFAGAVIQKCSFLKDLAIAQFIITHVTHGQF